MSRLDPHRFATAFMRGVRVQMSAAAAASVPSGPRALVSIDFGTSTSGYTIAFSPAAASGARGDAEAQRALVREMLAQETMMQTFGPGEIAESGKTLTAVLLENKPGNNFVAYGVDARRRWAQACDDDQQRQFLYFERFKMYLSPQRRERSVASITIPSAGGVATVPLTLPFVRVLEFIRKCALSKLDMHLGGAISEADVGWVLTVPAIWDDEAKAFMRDVATRAGLVSSANSDRLILALEPEGAALACVMLAAPDVRARMETLGTRLLVVDCGGGTVDVTVSEVKARDPLQLTELLPPSGGEWGGTYVDKNFETFLKRLLTESTYEAINQGVRVGVLDKWEATKKNYDPARPDEDSTVDISAVDRELEDIARDDDAVEADLDLLVERYNSRYGADGATCSLTRRRHVKLSPQLMNSLFEPLVKQTVDHVRRLLADPAAAGVAFVALVGGFAASPYMHNAVKRAFETPTCTIRPAKSGETIVRGATWYGAYPDVFIRSRKAKFSYGVLVCEKYDASVHRHLQRINNGVGDDLALVLQPLVVKGDDVEVDKREVISVAPTLPDDLVINVRLYRVDGPIARLEPGVQRTSVGTGPGLVPETARCATVDVDIGDRSIPMDDRTCRLEFQFGRGELTVRATAARTRAVRYANLVFGSGGV